LARRVRVGGPGKRTGGNIGTAPWADLTDDRTHLSQVRCRMTIVLRTPSLAPMRPVNVPGFLRRSQHSRS